jgi:hypothetical protein
MILPARDCIDRLVFMVVTVPSSDPGAAGQVSASAAPEHPCVQRNSFRLPENGKARDVHSPPPPDEAAIRKVLGRKSTLKPDAQARGPLSALFCAQSSLTRKRARRRASMAEKVEQTF